MEDRQKLLITGTYINICPQLYDSCVFSLADTDKFNITGTKLDTQNKTHKRKNTRLAGYSNVSAPNVRM